MASDQLRKRIEGWLNQKAGRRSGRLLATRLGAAVGTTIGRRAENQDRCLIMTASFPRTPERGFVLAALCDGMGGMAHGGAFASRALGAFVASVVHGADEPPDARLIAAANEANEAVHEDQSGHGGATLSAVFVAADSGITAVNVGDSRIYGVNENSRLTQLTTDDTLAAHLTALRGGDHSDIPKGDQLVQYIGMGPGLEPHIIPIDGDEPPDHLLITSDGAHYFNQDVMRHILGAAEDAEQAVGRLMTLSEWQGGRDNAAAIMAPLDGLTGFAPDDPPELDLIEIWGPFGKVEFMGNVQPDSHATAHEADKAAGTARDSKSPASDPSAAKTTPKKAGAKKTGAASAPVKVTESDAEPSTDKSAASKPAKTKPPAKAAPYEPKTGDDAAEAQAPAKKTASKKSAAKKSDDGKSGSAGAKGASAGAKGASAGKAGSGLSIKIFGGK